MAENSRTGYKVAAMLFVGFLCLAIIVALTYFTVQTISGRMEFCTLWTDVPGRLAILIISYYVAGICGYFPIPESYLLDSLPEPLMLWRLETWREIFTCFLISNMLQRLLGSQRREAQSPLLRDDNTERFYEHTIRHRSEPTPIIYPDERTVVPVVPARLQEPFSRSCSSLPPPSPLPRNKIPVISHSSSESFMSFDSPRGGFIVPTTQRTARPHYLSSLDVGTEQTGATGGSTVKLDSPPRTADDEFQLPNYPRHPWIFLRNPGGVPDEVRKLHSKNLRKERLETEQLTRRQRALEQRADVAVGLLTRERPESEQIAAEENSGRLSLNINPRTPYRTKCSRHRIRSRSVTRDRNPRERSSTSKSDTVTKSDADRQKMNTTTETAAECCDRSPNLQWKVERIKQTLTRTAESRVFVDLSQQKIDQERQIESGKSIDDVASGSSQAKPLESNEHIPVKSQKDKSKHDSSS